MIVLLNVPFMNLGRPGNSDVLTVSFVALLSVLIGWVRSRRDDQLVTVRTVAEAAQFAVLPPLRGGSARCAAPACTGLRSAGRWSAVTCSTCAGVRPGCGP